MAELKFQCIHSRVEKSGQIMGRFVIPALKPGQGITIGNILRRVLLADLEGIAITGVKIPGVLHEFSSIDGIREDLLEIFLSLKQIVFKSEDSFNTTTGLINVQGPGVITAKNIVFPESQIEIINPNQYIGTLVSDKNLQIELEIEKGVNYKLSSDMNHYKDENSDLVAVDAIFMPVLRVNYAINTNYTKQDSISESLILEILTNGSLTPEKALKKASQQVILWFQELIDEQQSQPIETPEVREVETIDEEDPILIEELQLSVRAYNCLKKIGIHTLNDLKQYSQEDIKNIKNFGKKSAQEVFTTLEEKFNIVLDQTNP